MNIQDDKQFTIYEKEINGVKYYRLQMSKKMQDGSYQNGYIDVKFAKCEPPKNRDRIYLKRAWISFYLSKDKHTIPASISLCNLLFISFTPPYNIYNKFTNVYYLFLFIAFCDDESFVAKESFM